MTTTPELHVLDQAAIERILPHRGRALMISDAMVNSTNGTGTTRLTVTEEHCAGHFPHNPMFPGMYSLEVAAQLAAMIAHEVYGVKPGPIRHWAGTYRGAARPGDELTFHLHDVHIEHGRLIVGRGRILCGGEVLCTIPDLRLALAP